MDCIGHVDGFEAGSVFGWAMDRNAPDEPVELGLQINGRPAGYVLAIHHRLDIQCTFGNAGLCGFRFKVPTDCSGRPLRFDILFPDGAPVEGSPLIVRVEAEDLQIETSTCRPVMFMHIQRTGGTAFRDAVLANYHASEVLLVYPDPPGISQRRVRDLPLYHRQDIRCVFGHFLFGVHEHIPCAGQHVTFVRNPIDRVVSNYRHLVSNRSQYVTRNGGVLCLDELLESGTCPEMDNLIVRYFTGEGEDVCPPGGIGCKEYKRAAAVVDRYFGFVGHQERSANGWDELRRIFGWRKGVLKMRNVSTEQQPLMTIAGDTRRRIMRFNEYDLALYDHIIRRFPL